MKHGEERNRRTETTIETRDWTVPGGSMTLPFMAVRESVAERWCKVCSKWVEARGIMGALLCVECSTPWLLKYRDISKLAENIYDGQSVTADEYPSAVAYVNDLIDLANAEGWIENLDGDQLVELQQELMRHAEADLEG